MHQYSLELSSNEALALIVATISRQNYNLNSVVSRLLEDENLRQELLHNKTSITSDATNSFISTCWEKDRHAIILQVFESPTVVTWFENLIIESVKNQKLNGFLEHVDKDLTRVDNDNYASQKGYNPKYNASVIVAMIKESEQIRDICAQSIIAIEEKNPELIKNFFEIKRTPKERILNQWIHIFNNYPNFIVSNLKSQLYKNDGQQNNSTLPAPRKMNSTLIGMMGWSMNIVDVALKDPDFGKVMRAGFENIEELFIQENKEKDSIEQWTALINSSFIDDVCKNKPGLMKNKLKSLLIQKTKYTLTDESVLKIQNLLKAIVDMDKRKPMERFMQYTRETLDHICIQSMVREKLQPLVARFLMEEELPKKEGLVRKIKI